MKSSAIIFLISLLSAGLLHAQSTEEWVQRFTSDSTRDENVNDMFVDAQGNVYVTGSQKWRFSGPNEVEAVTVKYNSQGVQQWIQNYQATGNNGAFGRAIHVDASGNVYITGETSIIPSSLTRALIVKYSPSGTQLWSYVFSMANPYHSGFDIITDATGNVYVTGEYFTGVHNNIFLVKFGPTGNLINQTFYDAGSEGARKIALDGNGKIIVAGYSNVSNFQHFVAVKYEQNLDFVWASRWTDSTAVTMNDMVVDINSNIILTGNAGQYYATVKFSSSGSFLWRKIYVPPSNYGISRAIASDNLGNIFVTGESGTPGLPPTFKITTVKYNSNGDQQWVRSYDSTAIQGYNGYDIALDAASNVYVTGKTLQPTNIKTIKYNAAGAFQWEKTYDGPANSSDVGVSIGVDANGNVYSTGTSLGTTTGYDIATIKYTQSPVMKLNLTLLMQGFYNSTTNKMRTDTARVYVRNANSPYALIDSSKSVLDSLGKANFLFFHSTNNVSYFLVARHRNSIETWSASGHSFNNDSMVYNFTSSSSQAYGNNEILKGSKYCIYSGDVNQDATVDLTDNQLIDNDYYDFASGYLSTDINGDLIVDIDDAAIADNNAYNFVSRVRP